MKYLLIVDFQHDFINGSLGTSEAQELVPKVLAYIQNFDGELLFTLDTHNEDYLDTQEGRCLPIRHCIKGTKGWHLPDEIEEIRQERALKTFEKSTFGCTKLAEYLKSESVHTKVESLEIIGLCTDICVVSNALLIKSFNPELHIVVNPQLCAGTTPERHNAALQTMASCQIAIK